MSFSGVVDKWVKQTEERLDAVYARSIELLAEEMIKTRPNGGRLPFQTGNLARSLLASKEGMPNMADGPFAGNNVGLVTADITAKEDLWLGFQANYARRMNYGLIGPDSLGRVYNQEGNYFVEGAIAEWSNIVKQAAEEVKNGG